MKFAKFLAAVLAAFLLIPLAAGCSQLGAQYPVGTQLFEYYAGDPVVSHEVGEAGTFRSWVVRQEEYVAGVSSLANDGVFAQIDGLHLPRGKYVFETEMEIFVDSDKASAINANEPVAYLQLLSEHGTILANEYILGTLSPESGDYLTYPLAFEIKTAGTYSLRIYNTGRNGIRASRMKLTTCEISDNVKEHYIAEAFAPLEEESDIRYEEDKLYYYDLRSVLDNYEDSYPNQFDITTILTAMQGIVNRDKPTLFVRFDEGGVETSYPETDLFWLEYLGEKDFLPSGEDVVEIQSIDTLLRLFQDKITGITIWDPLVPATSNVAYTDAGVNNTLPVRYSDNLDSVYYAMQGRFPVTLDLNGKFTGTGKIPDIDRDSTGSAKCDAYLWAMEMYIKTNKTNPYVMANYVDAWVGNDGYTPRNYYYPTGGRLADGTDATQFPTVWNNKIFQHCVTNRDYFVSEKAFFVDLNATDLHVPIDDPNQTLGTDLAVHEEILRASNLRAPDRSIAMGGFTKWAEKYSIAVDSSAIHGGTTEAIFSMLYTKYNVVWMPDANFSMANDSIYRLYEGKTQYVNKNSDRMKAAAENAVLENKNYILVYMGDYDSAAWLHRSIPTMFSDPRLGDYPLMWPVIPINDDRAAHVYDYMYENMSDNDVMVGGNNGLGYVYWSNFFTDRTGLYGDLDSYIAQTKEKNEKFDIDIMGCYFGADDPDTMNDAMYEAFMGGLAELYPSGVVIYQGSYTYRYDGVIFSGKDPGKNYESIVYQSGNQNFLAEGGQDDPNNDSIMENAINCTEEQRPMFHVARAVLCTPSDVFSKVETLQRKYPEYNFEIVDPYKFFKLYGDYRDAVERGEYL